MFVEGCTGVQGIDTPDFFFWKNSSMVVSGSLNRW